MVQRSLASQACSAYINNVLSYSKTDNELRINIIPNPVYEQTTISYQQSAKSQVTLSIFDMTGREVKQLTINNEQLTIQNGGKHSLKFDAKGLRSGVYFVKLLTDNGVGVGKFVKE